MFSGATWRERAADGELADRLAALMPADLPAGAPARRLLGRFLAARGVGPDTLGDYLDPDIRNLAPPEALRGAVEAAEMILDFAAAGRRITVFGDYDVDGVSATSILVRTLETTVKGCKVAGFIPERVGEGYGLSQPALKRMFSLWPDTSLLVTVDNGISAIEEIRAMKERGISVIVTDHHLPGAELPVADLIVDPRLDPSPETEETQNLCGAAVAFFIARAIATGARARRLYDGPRFAGPLLVLAGLATVTDVMPLDAQNRILVAEAIRSFNRFAPVGLKELVRADSLHTVEEASTWLFGWFLGPRLNAAGRMASASRAYELLSSDDVQNARMIAVDIKRFNAERQTEERRVMEAALPQLVEGASAQVVSGSDWRVGVAGIVAARILERSGSPSAVVVVDEAGIGHGSARAPEGYNLHDALEECASALDRFGGHAAAAGFNVKPGMLDRFTMLFRAACGAQRSLAKDAGAVEYDAEVAGGDLDLGLAKSISMMKPFGERNEEPVFLLRGLALRDVSTTRDGRHLSLSFGEPPLSRVMWWGKGEDADELRAAAAGRFDALVTVHVSGYGGEHVEAQIQALRPAS